MDIFWKLEVDSTLMFTVNVPKVYWGCRNVVYVINCMLLRMFGFICIVELIRGSNSFIIYLFCTETHKCMHFCDTHEITARVI